MITQTLKIAIDLTISPRMDSLNEPDAISKYMFSNKKMLKMEDREVEVLQPKAKNEQVIRNSKKIRTALAKENLFQKKTIPIQRCYF
jgi:2-oxoisovalerate dehydrogenase E1 component